MGDAGPAVARRSLAAFAGFTVVWFSWSWWGMHQLAPGTASVVSSVLYSGWSFAVVAAAALLLLLRRADPFWIPLIVGLGATTLGDLLWDLTDRGILPGGDASPAAVDLLYVPGYLSLCWTALALLGRYRRRGFGALLDAVVIAGAPTVSALPWLIDPYVEAAGQGPWAARSLNLFYPACDLMLTAVFLAAMLTLGRSRSLQVLFVAFALQLTADHVFLDQTNGGSYQGGGWLDWTWLLQYSLIAFAAACPLPPRPAEDGARAGVMHLVVLAACTVLCPTALVVSLLMGERLPVVLLGNAIASMVLAALVSARLIGVIRENRRTVQQLSDTLAHRDELTRELEDRANHDFVTGLPNRHHLVTAATSLHDHPAGTHCLVFIDLDDFKAVNDTHGHLIGDLVLRELGSRLLSAAGPHDLLARLGGDEFAVLMPHRAVGDGVAETRRILALLDAVISVGDVHVVVAASAGVAALSPGQGTVSDALARADVAMYAAKRAGKGQVLGFVESMREQVLGDADLVNDLVRDLRVGGLVAHYQPIVELGTGRVVGVEALARWSRNGRSMSPAQFLPLAEQRGLLVEVDLQMLDQTLTWTAAWRTRQPDLRVNVNISAQTLATVNITEVILAALADHGLTGDALTVEITEQTVVHDPVLAAERLEALRRQGVRIALDDFGTGYSSLSYLQQLPLDGLKLDRSFLTAAEAGDAGGPLLRLVVEMGHKLGMTVLAEGIETCGQRQAALQAGCETGQGWLFSKAVTGAEVMTLLEAQAAASATPVRGQTP